MADSVAFNPVEHAGHDRGHIGWFTWPALIPVLGLPVVIALLTPREYLSASLLAYLNCVLTVAAMIHFVRLRTLEGLIPVITLVWPLMAWPVATIYFAIFCPNLEYGLMIGPIQNLSGATRVQAVFLLFLVSYLVPACALFRPSVGNSRMLVSLYSARRVAIVTTWMAVGAFSLNVASKIVTFPGPLLYIADACFLYLNGVLFVVGAYFGYLKKSSRVLVIVFIFGCGFIYTLGNARGMALMPFVLMVVGLLFCADLPQKWKTLVVSFLLAGLPLYIVIGNTTRSLRMSVGFGNLSQRYEALKNWREVNTQTPFLTSTFGRLFYTGGHAMITRTPEYHDYVPFSIGRYSLELVSRLLPGKLYYQPFYSTTGQLVRYGFRITESTSVEVSLVGSSWALGGPFFVIAAGVVSALAQYLIVLFIRRARATSVHKAIFYMAMMGQTLIFWCNTDFISDFRDMIWHMLAGFVLYHVFIYWVVLHEHEEADPYAGLSPYAAPA